MQQVVFDVVTFPEYKIPSHNSVASNLPVSEKAEEWNAGEELAEGVRFNVLLGFVMLGSPADAGEHEADGVVFGDAGGLEALHRGFRHLLVDDILI